MRRRMIDPLIWDDLDIGSLSRDARLLFIGCFSLADDFGNILAESRYLQKKLFGYDTDVSTEQVSQWLGEVGRLRSTMLYAVNGQNYLHFNNWTMHQKLDSRYTPKASCPPCPDESPPESPELLTEAPEPPMELPNGGTSRQALDESEESDVKAPRLSDIERNAAKSKVNISQEKLSKAAAAAPEKPKPEPPSSSNNYAQVLREYEKLFGLLGSSHLYERFGDLWDEYPVLATHEYAREQMRQAMMRDEKPVSPNLRYYAKCLETGNRRNWTEGKPTANATQRRRAKQYPVADVDDPDIKRWMEEEKLRRQRRGEATTDG